MNDKTVNRIFDIMKTRNLSAAEVSRNTYIKPQVITQWKQGKQKPSADALSKLADYFDVSVDYLLGRTDDPQGNQFPAEEMYHIPVIATVAAGFGQSINGATHQDYQLVPKSIVRGYNKDDLFVFVVSGDSMSPKFLPGDRVLVVRQPSVDPGDIAIVSYDDYEDGTIKKVDYEPGCDYVDLIPSIPNMIPSDYREMSWKAAVSAAKSSICSGRYNINGCNESRIIRSRQHVGTGAGGIFRIRPKGKTDTVRQRTKL